MGQRSAIERLPVAAREHVHELIGFGCTIDEITAALEEIGEDVSRSSVGRYTKRYRAVADQMKEAREIATAFASELGELPQGKTGRLLVEMGQTLVFKFLMKQHEDSEDDPLSSQELMFLFRALKDLATASRIDAEDRLKLKKEAREEAAKAVETLGKKRGLDKETLSEFYKAAKGTG